MALGDRLVGGFPAAIDSAMSQSAIQNIFVEKDTIWPIRTRAVVILYKEQLIAERYADGFTAKTKLSGWSMTKTVTGALIGILVKQGKLMIDAPAPVPEWRNANDPRHSITIVNLLQQRSGLNFEENYSKASDATRMLFKKSRHGRFYCVASLEKPTGRCL